MVTLLGFMFIVGNVMLIEILMPDLIGPVSKPLAYRPIPCPVLSLANYRVPLGYITVLLSACGCKH